MHFVATSIGTVAVLWAAAGIQAQMLNGLAVVAGAGQASAKSLEVQPAVANMAVRLRQNRDRAPVTTDTLDFGDDANAWARDGECDDPRFFGEGTAQTQLDSDTYHDATDCRSLLNMGRIGLREAPGSATVASHVEDGQLDADDERLETGEFIDSYILEGCAGDKTIVELRSEEFDPYLIVRTPSDELLYNDDYEGDANRSLLALKLAQTAPYLIAFTSFESGETGAYTFEIRRAEPATLSFTASVEMADRGASAPPQPGESRVFDGMKFVPVFPSTSSASASSGSSSPKRLGLYALRYAFRMPGGQEATQAARGVASLGTTAAAVWHRSCLS